MRGIFM